MQNLETTSMEETEERSNQDYSEIKSNTYKTRLNPKEELR